MVSLTNINANGADGKGWRDLLGLRQLVLFMNGKAGGGVAGVSRGA